VSKSVGSALKNGNLDVDAQCKYVTIQNLNNPTIIDATNDQVSVAVIKYDIKQK